MKMTLVIVVLATVGFIGINYGSQYIMGGLESGMGNGGHGKYKQFHKDNKFAEYMKSKRDGKTGDFWKDNVQSLWDDSSDDEQNTSSQGTGQAPGGVNSNPFAE